MLLSVKMSVTYTFFKKDTHREKAPSNKTPALTKYKYGQITLVPFFRRTYALSFGFKTNLFKIENFAIKLAERNNHSFLLFI